MQEKPLSIALREINEGLLDLRAPTEALSATDESGRSRCASSSGSSGGIAAYKAC